MEKIILGDWMTVSEYAIKQGITVQAVYKAIKEGRMHSRKLGKLTLVHIKED